MFTCDVTKARSFASDFVSCEFIVDLSYRLNWEPFIDNVVLEFCIEIT